MVKLILQNIQALFSILFFIINTILWGLLITIFIPLKFLLQKTAFIRPLNRLFVGLGNCWIRINNFGLALTQPTMWDIDGLAGLDLQKSYLVIANHQSWVDIVVLQKIFINKIPFLRFFIKKQLMSIPILNCAWWALDFPIMQRHSKEYLARHPERKADDLKTIKKSCEKYIGNPVGILNFIEGTRFTIEKHLAQQSPYKRLLKPKSGGLSFVLDAMGEQFDSLLDVTIAYSSPQPSLWRFMAGDVHKITVRVNRYPIPKTANRSDLDRWLGQIWATKDGQLHL